MSVSIKDGQDGALQDHSNALGSVRGSAWSSTARNSVDSLLLTCSGQGSSPTIGSDTFAQTAKEIRKVNRPSSVLLSCTSLVAPNMSGNGSPPLVAETYCWLPEMELALILNCVVP